MHSNVTIKNVSWPHCLPVLLYNKVTLLKMVWFSWPTLYKDRAQNHDPEIHEEYLVHNTLFPLPHIIYSHVQTIAQL